MSKVKMNESSMLNSDDEKAVQEDIRADEQQPTTEEELSQINGGNSYSPKTNPACEKISRVPSAD
ncbi:MAG: hypothetical protein ACLSB9_18540 [Hydrogeniiclostridium mannosilyticum]